MNKKYLAILAVFGFLVASAAFAHNQAVLPNAGLTPESPFYVLDRFGEALRSFFTFNPEGKARLQITFAAERVAEIKVILETKGIEAKGLEVAQSRLQAHLASAATIVTDQKSKGKDVSALAKELDDGLETPKSALADSFKAEKRALEAKEGELKAELRAAHRAGDTTKAEALAQELGQVKAQKELLDLKAEDIDDELEVEEERLEEEIEAQLKAEKAIREAEEEKQEVIDEAVEEGIELPANTFAEFDGLLAQARGALQAGNFVEAKNLAKRAEKSLDQIEKMIEGLEKKQEKKEEAEEAIKEAEEEKQEVLNEARKEGVELLPVAFAKFDRLLAQAKELFARGNYEGAKQLAEQAKDAIEDVDKEIEKLKKEKERKEERTKKEEEREREETTKQEKQGREPQVKNNEPESATVVIGEDGSFSPTAVKIQKGGKVIWINKSSRSIWPASAMHPTHLIYPEFDARKSIGPGESYSFEFERVGSWKYHNHLNTSSVGTVNVVE